MADTWLTSLITRTPQEGFELAITLSRRGVKYTQPDVDVLKNCAPITQMMQIHLRLPLM